MEDTTDEALRRIRAELARRGLTLVGSAEDTAERYAVGVLRGYTPTRPEHVTEPARLRASAGRAASRSWLRYTLLAFGVLAVLPWLAPVFAAAGWWGLADPIYTLYLLLCHQLPERAATLFGYQVAFCWRNAAIYGGLFGFGLLYAWATRMTTLPGSRGEGSASSFGMLPRAIPLWGFVLTLVPMALDGFSHMFGLRDGSLGDPIFGSFLVGSQFLSLNWWLRVSTGLVAAFGTVWFTFPRLDKYLALTRAAALASVQPRVWSTSADAAHRS
ncbi:MAG TPA: DUF2085 domain-containing protein [Chloroflexia bacterium]|nr:DUF2085 domain-containing protein [Chloroflexia bacterium]